MLKTKATEIINKLRLKHTDKSKT